MPDHIPTLADVCCAIAEGRLAAASDGHIYEVSAFELRRYFNKRRPLSAPSLIPASAPQALEALLPSADLCGSGR